MNQIRRVNRSTLQTRTARPDAAGQTLAQDTVNARLATVTQLFPANAKRDQPRVENIFADLEYDRTGPAARARARALRLLPNDGVPRIDNIFADDCPDLTPEAEARMQAQLAARPRKMALARAQITAAHDERAATLHPMAQELPRVAASLAAMIAVVSALQLPHA